MEVSRLSAAIKFDVGDLHPGRTDPGDTLKELLACMTIDVPVQDLGPVDEVRQDYRCDLAAIIEKVALRVTVLRPEDLGEVGHMQGVVDDEGGSHGCAAPRRMLEAYAVAGQLATMFAMGLEK
jgi:hypothetical protein